MSTGAVAGSRDKEAGAYRYQRHQPENTLLYQIVERYYPEFTAYLAEQGAVLPRYVEREFEAYLKCGRLEHGFLRVRCNHCQAEHLVAFRCKCRGFCPSCGARRVFFYRADRLNTSCARRPRVTDSNDYPFRYVVPAC